MTTRLTGRWPYEFVFKDLLGEDDSDEAAERIATTIAERMGAIGQYPFPLWLREGFEDTTCLEDLNEALSDLYDYGDRNGVWFGLKA